MSRRTESGDSLELLLDTICNMFGGIVFISILVAVMLQTSEDQFVSEVEPIDLGDLELLAQDLNHSQLKLEGLQQARQRQIELISTYIPADLEDQLSRLKSLGQERAELESQAGNLERSNLRRITSVTKSREEFAKIEEELRSAEKKLAMLEQQRQKAAQRHAVKLPRARMEPNLEPIQVSLHYDRLYFRHKFKNGVREVNDEDYVISEVDDEQIVVQARPTAGIPLDGSGRSAALMRQKLAPFPNSKNSISITIWPDSFDSFRAVQQLLIDAGYRYDVLPCSSGDNVTDRGGDARMAQ